MMHHLSNLLLVNDTLESVFDESGDEEEQDAIVSQVLDEIGIEISGKVTHPRAVLTYNKANKIAIFLLTMLKKTDC